MKRGLSQIILLLFLILTLGSCSNSFDYKENKWVQVVKTRGGNSQNVYVDENRIDCNENNECTVWLKIEFDMEKQIPFSGNKVGEQSGFMLAKRIDSSVKYYCKSVEAQIISYQIYNSKNKLIDSKWIKGDINNLQAGTVDYDIWRYICLKKK